VLGLLWGRLMTDVFISYKREEREAARRLAEALQKHGLSVWWDADLLPGEQYRAVTLEILQSCRAAVVIWSPKSVQSSWVLDEAQRALDRGVLVPVHVERIGAYPLGFGQVHAHDLTAWDGSAEHAALQPVIAAVQRLAGERNARPRATANPADVETEVAFWRGVHDSRDGSDFEAYLARYPEGLFSDLARRRAEALATPELSPAPAKRRKRKTAPRAEAAAPAPALQKLAAAPAPTPQRLAAAATETSAPFTAHELGFIAVVTVLSAFLAWPIANSALGLQKVFYPQDYELLLSLATPQNIIIMTPLLVGLAWGYDRAKAWWASKGRSPQLVQYGLLALLVVFFLLSLNMRQYGGRETHMALWLIFVWTAASFARPAVGWARPLIMQQLSRRT
jgi:hypothetical protein